MRDVRIARTLIIVGLGLILAVNVAASIWSHMDRVTLHEENEISKQQRRQNRRDIDELKARVSLLESAEAR